MSDETAAPTPGLTKVTVNLIPHAMSALTSAAGRCGHTHTETINRALTLYDEATDVASRGGGRLKFSDLDGPFLDLEVAPGESRLDAAARPPSQPEPGSLGVEVSVEAPGALGVARGRRRAARLLRSAARNIQGMHPEVAQEWLLSTADSFEKAADEANRQSAAQVRKARDDFGVVTRAQGWTEGRR